MYEVDIAEKVIEDGIRSTFEKSWYNTTTENISDYRILIWGSVIEDNKNADDLDLIFEYTNDNITPDMEKSIEGQIRSETYINHFDYVDPLVIHYSELPEIVSNSRVSKVYSVGESGWLKFDK